MNYTPAPERREIDYVRQTAASVETAYRIASRSSFIACQSPCPGSFTSHRAVLEEEYAALDLLDTSKTLADCAAALERALRL